MPKIEKFEDQYFFLSNFFPVFVEYAGIKFKTSEHAYQWSKTHDEKWKEKIEAALTPNGAKKLGKPPCPMRADWDRVKVSIMREIVAAKFDQNPSIKQLLDETKGIELIEGNWWHDKFWGVCDGVGQNWLGKILMEYRDKK